MGNIPSISDVGLSSLFVSTLHFLKNLNEHDNASKAQPSMKRLGNTSEEDPGRNSMGEETSLFKCFCIRPSEANVRGESTLENEMKLLQNVLCLACFFYQSHTCMTYIYHIWPSILTHIKQDKTTSCRVLLMGWNRWLSWLETKSVGPEGAWLEEVEE